MSDLGNILLNLVIILVAGVVGALLAGWLVQFGCRLWVRRQAPQVVVQAVRVLSGLACAVLAYLLLSTGGSGFGFGGGTGLGMGPGAGKEKGGATGKGTGAEATNQEPPATKKGSTEPQPKVVPAAMLRVEMLGGQRYQPDSNRFYLVEGDKQPKTLGELSVLMQERLKQPGFPGIEIVIYRTGSVAASHAAVKELNERAAMLGLPVKMTIHTDQDAPPLP